MQEVGVDVTYASQMFIVEQINYHRKMAEKLETLYHQCWPTNSGEQAQGKSHYCFDVLFINGYCFS